MNTAVVIPPVEDFYFSPRRFASLGAFKGAEILNAAGFSTTIFDFTKGAKHKIEIPKPISYLNQYIMPGEKGPCSFFTTYTHFGYDAEKCASIVAAGNYNTVFVSLFAFCYAGSAIAFAKSFKKLKPAVKIIACGAGVSVFPEYFRNYFDAIITGEAEIFLAQCKESKLMGKSGGGGNYAKDLALPHELLLSLPTAPTSGIRTKAGDFIPSAGIAYADKKSICISIMLSRGCFKQCRFCSNFITHGRGFRNTEPEQLKETLAKMLPAFENHSNRKIFINIEDDNILCGKPVFFKQLDVIKEFFLKIGVSANNIFFSAENGLDYMLLDPETCAILIENYNFRQFNFTLTSLDKEVTASQKRDCDLSLLEKILLFLGEQRVPAITYFIAGLDSDSPEKAINSLLFLAKNPGLSGISMFYAVPGLPGFDSGQFLSTISPELCRGSSAYPWNNTLSTKQLLTAFRISRTINFLKKEAKQLQSSEKELRKRIIAEKKLFTITAGNSIAEPKHLTDSDMVEIFFSGMDAAPCAATRMSH
ncbi:MAG: hypothetical protein FWC36_03565 [Spirochaetes bacterium]|nr:hypothetical protein [Spirochaetota bacterium]